MKKENWKEIIDPCFDEMVKSFLSGIRFARNLPNEGLFQMPEKINKTVLLNNSLNSSFAATDEQFINYLKEIDSDKTNLIFKVFEKNGNDSDSTQELLNIANELPEESKNFYIREFNSISDESELINNNLKGKEKEKAIYKSSKHATSVVSSLFSRYLSLCMDTMFEKDGDNERDDLLLNPRMGDYMMSSFYHFFSQIAFKSTLNELLNKGDDQSLLKAIRIDKTSIYSEPVKNRLMKAQLSGDNKFLNKLGNAIKANPLQKEDLNHETYIILRQFWPVGLYRLKHETLYYFLKDDCGLIPPEYPSNFEKFLQRHIKPLFN